MVMAIRNTERMLEGFAAASAGRASVPVPLKSASYDVKVVSGIAVVKQTRVFRNDEVQPVEATLTFPVGYDAVVSDVRATVGGRTLVGVSKERKQARATYEKALDDGKATVLHEELMRGLHMVSVGNIAPGEEIVVEATSVSPLSVVESAGKLRIPLTIGAIYGTSPLIPSDDILADGVGIDAEIAVRGADGVKINGLDASVVNSVKTSAVIDISIPALSLRPLQAKMPSGSWASVNFAVPCDQAYPIDADLLLDTSGSMAESAHRGPTKWSRTIEGLSVALSQSTFDDHFRFWTFADECHLRSEAVGPGAASILKSIPFDDRGTRLAEAVHKVAASRAEANILLVTDGKSHTQIDYERVRKSGARFTVVLVGRGSFEPRVAQLAALTGGQMFVVDASDDIATVVATALSSMRTPSTPIVSFDDIETPISRMIGGLSLSVSYQSERSDDTEVEDSVVALVAGLAVSSLPAKKAGSLAEQAGIVSHLTSIVMVDSEGPVVDGIAVNRKVALAQSDETVNLMASMPFGSTGAAPMAFASASLCAAPRMYGGTEAKSLGNRMLGAMRGFMEPQSADGGVSGYPDDLFGRIGGHDRSRTTITTVIETERGVGLPVSLGNPVVFEGVRKPHFNWGVVAEVINGSTEEQLGNFELVYVRRIAASVEVIALSRSLGISAVQVALALVAKVLGGPDRQAQRIARKILGNADALRVDAAAKLIS